jgi:molecular chaperone DnaK (HSP70)
VTRYLAKEFMSKYKEDLMVHKKAKAKLSLEAEKVKHVLSTLGDFYIVKILTAKI